MCRRNSCKLSVVFKQTWNTLRVMISMPSFLYRAFREHFTMTGNPFWNKNHHLHRDDLLHWIFSIGGQKKWTKIIPTHENVLKSHIEKSDHTTKPPTASRFLFIFISSNTHRLIVHAVVKNTTTAAHMLECPLVHIGHMHLGYWKNPQVKRGSAALFKFWRNKCHPIRDHFTTTDILEVLTHTSPLCREILVTCSPYCWTLTNSWICLLGFSWYIKLNFLARLYNLDTKNIRYMIWHLLENRYILFLISCNWMYSTSFKLLSNRSEFLFYLLSSNKCAPNPGYIWACLSFCPAWF